MTCYNYFYILVFSLVVCNLEAYRCLCLLLPTLGGRRFSIVLWLFLLLMLDPFAFYVPFLLIVCGLFPACWWCFDFCVQDLVLCAGAVVFIIGLCLFFMFLRLAIVDCSTPGTAGVDIVVNF